MGITARVQHHPARAVFLPRLLEALAPLPTEVIIDPEPYELASPWRTYLACLADPPDCSHLLIVQDDAVPCRGFTAAVEQVALANPDTPVCLFISREARNSRIALMEAIRRQRPYVDLHWRDFMPVVAVLWPIQAARSFHEWALANPRATNRNPRSDDAMAGKWMSSTRQRVRVTVPSLVEHPDTEPSLIKPHMTAKHRTRRAVRFIGDGDPLEIDWSGR